LVWTLWWGPWWAWRSQPCTDGQRNEYCTWRSTSSRSCSRKTRRVSSVVRGSRCHLRTRAHRSRGSRRCKAGGCLPIAESIYLVRHMITHICLAHQRSALDMLSTASVGVFAFSAAGPATSSASVAPVLAGAASASGASESLASTKQLTPSSSVVPSSVLSSGDASSTVSASAAAWAAAQSASAAATAITRASGCGLRIARTCRCGRRGGTLSAGWQ
jgi:hypothetical protein